MSLVCHSCAGEIDDFKVECRGFCKAIFHLRCSGIHADALEEMMNNEQFHWLCPSCTALMKEVRFRNTVRAVYEIGPNQALNTDMMQSLKSEIMVELKAEIRTNFAKLINSSSCTPKSSKRVGFDPQTTRGRRLFSTAKESIPKQQPPLLLGTGSTPSPSNVIATVPPVLPKFWLYLSRIAKDVSADQICAFAKKRLGADDIQVTRLVAKGRDISTLSFVSFKIGMSMDLKSKALSTSTWPKGILYREFNNRSGEDFWRPIPVVTSDVPPNLPMEEVVSME